MIKKELAVLAIESDVKVAAKLQQALRKIDSHEIDFIHSSTTAEAKWVLAHKGIDLAFVDHRLGGQSGLDLLVQLRAAGDLRPLIVIAGPGEKEVAEKAIQAGADEAISPSSLTPENISIAISTSIARARSRRHHQQLIAELQAKNEAMEEDAQRCRELFETAHQFVNDVSHDFRTPLTVIKEFSSIIKDGLAGPTTSVQQEYLGIVLDRVGDLSIMIEDMLDMSRLEAGHLGMRRKVCGIESVIDPIRPMLDQKASLREIRIEFELPTDLPLVYCDPEKVARVLVNLGINAVKFSPDKSKIQISARSLSTNGEIRFTIKDQGPGIHPDSLSLLFERFSQIGTPNRSAIKGYGLGLNICKELVHLNFGDIGVESQLGEGSAFWFTLPTAHPPHLIRRYLDRVKTIQRDAEFISLVIAQVPSETDLTLQESAEQFLHQNLRHSDLVLGVRPHRWLIVLASNRADVDPILRKSQDAWHEANLNNPLGGLVSFDFQKRGGWRLGEHTEEFISNFENACNEEVTVHA